LVFLNHWHGKKRPSPCEVDGSNTLWVTFSVGRIRFEIRNVRDLLCARETGNASVRTWAYWAVLLPEQAPRRGNIMQMCRVVPLTIVEQDVTELGFANAQSVRKHRLEYRLHVAG
jgi:hypothetical protein